MKVLLIKSVEDLGLGGDVVDVANGYARNYLFPRNLAVKATSSAIKSSESYRSKALEEQTRISNESQQLADKLRDFAVEIKAAADENGHLYGSVNEQDIVNKLKEKDLIIDKHNVKMEQHIKELGDHEVTIELRTDINGTLNVKVEKEEKE